ncbi:CD209 antigen-like protein E [Physella acuta]|uniref:CD209 antigen-like protein E n=1 Tax=Physella acuta TaxID=109671 RepID=UPI0027DBB8C2|nr:CD209 antigen-like protein E [Physella acuta]
MTTKSSLFSLDRRTNVRMLYTADQLLYRSSSLACAADCSHRSDTCFSYSYSKQNQSCRLAKGAQLYTFKIQEKYNILLNIYNNTQVDTWIGLNDMVKEGELMWDDGTTLVDSWKTVIFKPGLPDDRGGDEDCVQLNSAYYPLNDIFCNNSRKYICEINPTGF